MSKRWLYLASGSVASQAANAVHVLHMCDALVSHGFKVSILSPSSSTRPKIYPKSLQADFGLRHRPHITNVWKPRFKGGGMIFRIFLRFLLVITKADRVYGRCLYGTAIASQMGLPTVLEIHKPEWKMGDRKSKAFTEVITGPGFQALVCISYALEKHLLDEYPELTGRTFVAHDAAPRVNINNLGSESEPFRVGYFGSLHPGKGVETIVSLAALCPWAEFLLVGGNAAAIDFWSKNRIIPSNMHFMGHQPHSSLGKIMISCDVLVAPYLKHVSVHGGGGDVAPWMSPLKLFEYMAAGRPIIASDLPVLREVLYPGINALVAAPGDPQNWAEMLKKLRDNPEFAKKLAMHAKADFEVFYTWDARVARISDELEKLE